MTEDQFREIKASFRLVHQRLNEIEAKVDAIKAQNPTMGFDPLPMHGVAVPEPIGWGDDSKPKHTGDRVIDPRGKTAELPIKTQDMGTVKPPPDGIYCCSGEPASDPGADGYGFGPKE